MKTGEKFSPSVHFYPRPPCGGRRINVVPLTTARKFLSTPSVWRATSLCCWSLLFSFQFLSTPSVWRATGIKGHPCSLIFYFYPRPPCGGRRQTLRGSLQRSRISIHALRVEGDAEIQRDCFYGQVISIHALRVEGDFFGLVVFGCRRNFYPRPPCGGRLKILFKFW